MRFPTDDKPCARAPLGIARTIVAVTGAAVVLAVAATTPVTLLPARDAWAQSHEAGDTHTGGSHTGGSHTGGGHVSGGHGGGHRYGSGRRGAKHSGGVHVDHLHADSGAVGGADLEDNVFRQGGGYAAFATRGRDGVGEDENE